MEYVADADADAAAALLSDCYWLPFCIYVYPFSPCTAVVTCGAVSAVSK